MSGTNLLDCVEGGAVAADAGSDDHEVVVEPAARGHAIASRRRSHHAPPSGHQLRRAPGREWSRRASRLRPQKRILAIGRIVSYR